MLLYRLEPPDARLGRWLIFDDEIAPQQRMQFRKRRRTRRSQQFSGSGGLSRERMRALKQKENGVARTSLIKSLILYLHLHSLYLAALSHGIVRVRPGK